MNFLFKKHKLVPEIKYVFKKKSKILKKIHFTLAASTAKLY